jgi:hypothetical protein
MARKGSVAEHPGCAVDRTDRVKGPGGCLSKRLHQQAPAIDGDETPPDMIVGPWLSGEENGATCRQRDHVSRPEA